MKEKTLLLIITAIILMNSHLCAQGVLPNIRLVNVPSHYKSDTLYNSNDTSIAGRYMLDEMTIIDETNPAYRLMDSVYANRKKHDPDNIGPMRFKTYDKAAAVLAGDEAVKEYITNEIGYKTNLFVMESISEAVVVPPNGKKETVVASKISGVKQPQFNIFLSELSNVSIYQEDIKYIGDTYLSPVNHYVRGNNKKYYFNIEDTIINAPADTTFVLSFRPLLKQDFNGFKGVIKVNSVDWAVESVIADFVKSGASLYDLKINHKFNKHPSGQWLPSEWLTVIGMANGLIAVDTASLTTPADSLQADSAYLFGYPQINVERYFYDYEYDSTLRKRDVGHIKLDMDENAYYKSDTYWNNNRYVPLTEEDENAYKLVDSISKEAHLDKLANLSSVILNGYIPIWIFNMPIEFMAMLDNYEKLRLGIGLETNSRLSKHISLGGFWGWGFRDAKAKWGIYAKALIDKRTDFRAMLGYSKNICKTSSYESIYSRANLFDPETYRYYLGSNWNTVKTEFVDMSIRPFSDFKFSAGFYVSNKKPLYDYQYVINNSDNILVTRNEFNFTTLYLGVTFAYKETFVMTPMGLKSRGTKFPILTVDYQRGMKGVLHGEYAYDKIEASLFGRYNVGEKGKFTFEIKGGYIDSDIPYPNLFVPLAGYSPITYFAPRSFGTMRVGEFVSDLYAYIFLQYDFGNIFNRKGLFRPSPSLVFNYGYGNLINNSLEKHIGIDARTMEKGFYEAGFLVNDLFGVSYLSFGLGVMCRFGYYSFPKVWDNLSLKFTVTM
ncbi:MAG: hypothetical protein IJM12_06225 [Bacteroidales bacterium]|nr:hypothetical protein [Bacteroidales bacterium]